MTPMEFSYIDETYTRDRRPQVVGTLMAVRTVSYLVMVQLIGIVVAGWGWKQAFLFLVAPMTVVGLLLSQRIPPSIRSNATTKQNECPRGLQGCPRIELRVDVPPRQPTGRWRLGGGVVTYSVTYLREGFTLLLPEASKIFSLLVVGVLVGNYFGGLLARWIGCKRVMVASSFLTGLLIISYMSSPSLALTVVLSTIMSVTAGVILMCANALLLVQVPRYR